MKIKTHSTPFGVMPDDPREMANAIIFSCAKWTEPNEAVITDDMKLHIDDEEEGD